MFRINYILTVFLFVQSSVACAAAREYDYGFINQIEAEYRIPSNLLAAIVKVESDFDANAVSGGAPKSYGLAQVTKATAAHRCGLDSVSSKVLLAPTVNLNCAAAILKDDIEIYGGNLKLVIAAYNAGTACVCDGHAYFNAHDGKICNLHKKAPVSCERKGIILNRGYIKKVEIARRDLSRLPITGRGSRKAN